MKNSEIIKEIRSCLNLSQNELAEKLGVSFATVNRWENGHCEPSQIAMNEIKRLCSSSDIDFSQFKGARIISRDETVTLYHGSKSGIRGAIAPVSRAHCDFGKGFYMGTEPEQALTLICDYDKSKFYILSVDVSDLAILEVPVNIEWAMIVAYHRGRMDNMKGTDFYDKYRDLANDKDMIVGSIANDRMFYVIDNFFVGNITDAALVNSLSALELGKQYVAVTQKACAAVKIECEIELSHLERQFLKEVAETNRTRGISFANEICKNYRREGLYFDEILEVARKEVEG